MMWAGNILDSILDTVDAIGNTISDGYEYTTSKSAKVWNACTGEGDFREAEKLREKIEIRFTEAHEKYCQVVGEVIPQIKYTLNVINSHKEAIYDFHFNSFKGLANRLHNLTIQGESFIEFFDDKLFEIKTITGVRSQTELYKIDFDNLNLTDILFGWLTLGITSRKKAKETLHKVQEEDARINEDIAKMEAHSKKLKMVLESLENIENYFQSLIHSYSKLLTRFEYGIQSQIQRQLLSKIPLSDGKINFRLMPLLHMEEFQALFNLSIVLKTMATMGYLNEEIELEEKDLETFTSIQNLVQETFHGQIEIAA